MKKRTVMHIEKVNVVTRFLKSDFAGYLIEEGENSYLPAGTLVKVKDTYDIREKGGFVIPSTTGKADGILVHDIEFKGYETEKPGTVTIEGVAYLDKLIEVGKEHKSTLTVTKEMLPTGITYIYKTRK